MFRHDVKLPIVAVLSIAALLAADPSPAAKPRPAAPDWQLRDVNGKPVNLAEFKGRLVVLNFWATWCLPCRQEIPGFVALQRKYQDKGLVIIGVSLDQRGPGVVKPFIGRFGVNYPVVMGNEQIVSDYGGVEAIPTTFIIDRQGKVVTVHQGFTDNATFEAEIRSLL